MDESENVHHTMPGSSEEEDQEEEASVMDETAPAPPALVYAAREGDTKTVLSLLNQGCPIDACDEQGMSPLATAARFGQHSVVRL